MIIKMEVFRQYQKKIEEKLFCSLAGGLLLLMVCTVRWGISRQMVIMFLFIVVLARIVSVDVDALIIPNDFVMAVFLLGAASIFLLPGILLSDRIFGSIFGGGLLFLVTLFVPGAFGGGDIKLMAAGGFFMGWEAILSALVCALMAGGVYSIYLLAGRMSRRKMVFAFGPFLCAGMITVCLLKGYFY